MTYWTPEMRDEEYEPLTPSGVPCRVAMAMEYVRMCSNVTASHGFPVKAPFGESYFTEVHRDELHPAQESALRCACNCLGKYFDGTL